MKKLCALLLLFPAVVQGQGNEIIRFNTRTQQRDTLPAVPTNTAVQAGRTTFSLGQLPGPVVLSNAFPTSNLVPGTRFSRRVRAAAVVPVATFPARTAVYLYTLRNGRRVQICTGTLVAERYVLTAAHCLCDAGPTREISSDSTLVAPAFDNGQFSGLPTTSGFRYYFFKSWLDGSWDDLALMELAQPIGRAVGWLGVGFDTDSANYRLRPWHKFSYPGQSIIPPNAYNGDTLFYEYGRVQLIGHELTVPRHTDVAIGQSGSSLFQTDNASFWTAYGVLSTAIDFVHQGLSVQQFAAVRRVLESVPLATAPARRQDLLVYPNPVRDVLHVALPAGQGPATLTLHDAVGRLVRAETHPRPSRGLQLNLAGVLPGIYALRVAIGQQVFQCKIVKATL